MRAVKDLQEAPDVVSGSLDGDTKQTRKVNADDSASASRDHPHSKEVEAKWITPQDPVLETSDGRRLPIVPTQEVDNLGGQEHNTPPAIHDSEGSQQIATTSVSGQGGLPKSLGLDKVSSNRSDSGISPQHNLPPAKINPRFPRFPVYGHASFSDKVHALLFRFCASILSLCFLGVIVVGAMLVSLGDAAKSAGSYLKGKDSKSERPFAKEERRRRELRKEDEDIWRRNARRNAQTMSVSPTEEEIESDDREYKPLEGGKDKLVCDIGYYARRVGLDVEEFKVQTEDGFLITLWHLFNPREYTPASAPARAARSPAHSPNNLSGGDGEHGGSAEQHEQGRKRYPVLLIHGLLQSAGAFCCNDDDSLAFYLAKSGYDVWLGNNRSGFLPEHRSLAYRDPRMWAWNIRHMGVMDLPALLFRVIEESGFERVALVCHSQGTTQTFIALAKEQRPDIADKISVFCALAPAVYAGPLIKRKIFKFMRLISPTMFRVTFGIHAFIPFMMKMHSVLPRRLYGNMGYRVFTFLFDWTDQRWDRGLRNRMFQFSPTYVSAESMRWWLGRDGFARQKCILSTKDEMKVEDEEDEEEDEYDQSPTADTAAELTCQCNGHVHGDHGRYAWFGEKTPPFAFWIAGNDSLVDGMRLLRRFRRGREPHVDLVHARVIDEYEHLDVIWAMDCIEKVGCEVKEVIWQTASAEARSVCRLPSGCENIATGGSGSESTLVGSRKDGVEPDEQALS